MLRARISAGMVRKYVGYRLAAGADETKSGPTSSWGLHRETLRYSLVCIVSPATLGPSRRQRHTQGCHVAGKSFIDPQ